MQTASRRSPHGIAARPPTKVRLRVSRGSADTAIKDNEGRLAADWAQEGGCPEVSALIFDAYRQKLKAAAAEKAKAKAERKAQREAEAAARQKAARDAAAGREL